MLSIAGAGTDHLSSLEAAPSLILIFIFRCGAFQVFLYILEQQVVGCTVVETVTKAWRVVSTGLFK